MLHAFSLARGMIVRLFTDGFIRDDILLIVSTKNLDISSITDAVRKAARGTLVSKAYLFGSRARGDFTNDSDIDLCIEADRGFTLIDAGALADAVSNSCGCEVDIVSERFLTPAIRKKVLNDRILLYERQ